MVVVQGSTLQIPSVIAEASGLIDCDAVAFEEVAAGVIMRPATPSEIVDAEYASGRFERFASDEAFDRALRSHMRD
jgi:hypothetical protein